MNEILEQLPGGFVGLLFVVGFLLFGWGIFTLPFRLLWFSVGQRLGLSSPDQFYWLVGFISWRLYYKPCLAIKNWYRNQKIGMPSRAKWAGFIEAAANIYRPGDILLGWLQLFGIPLFAPIGTAGERMLTVLASIGSGKTVYLISLLGLNKGNAFVIDVDGQMFNAMRRRIGDGGRGIISQNKTVRVLDPYSISAAEHSSHYNPFDEIDLEIRRRGKQALVDKAKTLAESLIKHQDNRNAWVYESSRAFLTSVICYVYLYEPPENHNLNRVYELIKIGLRGVVDEKFNPFDVLLGAMLQKDDFGGIIAKGAELMKATESKQGGNPLRSDCIQQLSWLDLPEMQEIVSGRSDFTGRDLKLGNTSVFLVAPATDIKDKLSGFFRMLSIMTLSAFEKIPERPKRPCLFIFDEIASLKLDILTTAAAVFRKYGVRVVTVSQNLERLRAAFPDNYLGFLGDSEACVFLSNEHKETLEYLSSVLGNVTRTEKVKPSLWKRIFSINQKPHFQQVERPLATPQQLREYLNKYIVVTRAGKRPLRLSPAPYYSTLPVYYYDPDKFYGETLLRRGGRRLCGWLDDRFHYYQKEFYKLKAGKPKAKKIEN